MIGRIVALVIGLVTALGLVMVPGAAQAATVPYEALKCTHPGARGGWDVRDWVATGTYHTDTAPVRGRTLRVGEPCVGEFEDFLQLPTVIQDLPVPMLDEDEDGEDDGAPEPEVEVVECGVPADPDDRFTNRTNPTLAECNQARAFASTWRGRVSFVSTGGDLTMRVVTVTPGTGTVALGYVCVTTAAGTPTHSGVTTLFSGSVAGKTLLQLDEYEIPVSCPAGRSLVVVTTTAASFAGDVPVKVLFGFDGALGDDEAPDYGSGYFGGSQEAPMVIAPTPGEWQYPGAVEMHDFGVDWSTFSCANSYDGPVAETFRIAESTLIRGYSPVPLPPRIPEGGGDPIWNVADTDHPSIYLPLDPGFSMAEDCPYLVEVKLWVCTWSGNHPSTSGCAESTWRAEWWRDGKLYISNNADDPGVILCKVFPENPGCFDVLNPPVRDGSNFDEACADAPTVAWNDWSNLGAWIGHYARCLFVPLNGFDRGGWVASAWDQSAGGALATLAAEVASALTWTDSCGVLFSGDAGGFDLELDTCSWMEWSGPVRTIFGAGVVLMGGWFIAMQVMGTVLSVVNKRVQNPLKGDDDK